MTPKQVLGYYGSQYKFHQKTGMSRSTLGNWLRWGYVPVVSQIKVSKLTDGKLKADIEGRMDE